MNDCFDSLSADLKENKIYASSAAGCDKGENEGAEFGSVWRHGKQLGLSRTWTHLTPTQAVASLKGRHVSFLGDSTVLYEWVHMVCYLQQTGENYIFLKDGCAHGQCALARFPGHGITLEFKGGGQTWKEQGMDIYDLATEIPKEATKLSRGDILYGATSAHANSMNSSHEYDAPVSRAVAAIAALETGPHVLWREATPQHFPHTSNGAWPGQWDSDKCAPITAEMRNGTQLINGRCVPECSRANFRNEINNPILEQSTSTTLIKVWDTLADHPQWHCGATGDCTHWSKKANAYLNQHLLHALQIIVEKPAYEEEASAFS